MKFSNPPKETDVNVSRQKPLQDFLVGAAALLIILALVYVACVFGARLLAKNIDLSTEQKIAAKLGLDSMYASQAKNSPYLTEILQKLLQASNLKHDLQVQMVCDKTVNAIAIPGGRIVIFEGLLRKIRSENALAMVLGHEVGHFTQRHHLEGMAAALPFALLLSMVGVSANVDDVLNMFSHTIMSGHSRQKEMIADRIGIEMLQKAYGHVGAATEFFEKMDEEEGLAGDLQKYSWTASHPHARKRIETLEAFAKEKQWPSAKLIPLNKEVLAEACKPFDPSDKVITE